MNSTESKPTPIHHSSTSTTEVNRSKDFKIHPPEKQPLTFGQRLADRMASKVGSWAFLIGQTTVLAGWVGANLMPGVPHWDESPFIMLNLVFSFASAYTAPVVLMSQNRQSEEDRENAQHNYQVTLQAAQNIELLHEKLDAEYNRKLDELTALIQQQQQTPSEVKVVFVPVQANHEPDFEPVMATDAVKAAQLSMGNSQVKGMVFVNVPSDCQQTHLNLDDATVTITE
ncbi:DUF1003 domain-containing protein [Pantanalinema sp. GBBB05]|uniref:DUF1003 domain-containing protein n=1 Tax=Pantanalinema sp. GBBB05 TaxID=2604139 RepID=UPI001E102E2C|nr:DUF1003 domain-containing protein [Pantanalinema sp. GBBB05]